MKKGFTLIELMVVMVILSILAVIVTGTFASSSRRGRDTRRKNDLRAISGALEAYYNDKGKYPTGVSGVMYGCGDAQVCTFGSSVFKDSNNTLYMTLLPTDPSIYTYYYVSASGASYQLYAKIENTLDMGTGVKQSGYSGTNCGNSGTVMCTYGISSSNTTP